MKIDAMRHGRQVEVTAGEVANPATWEVRQQLTMQQYSHVGYLSAD